MSFAIYKAYTIQSTLFYFLTSTSSHYISRLYTLLSLCLTYQSLTFMPFFTLLSKILIKVILNDGHNHHFLYFYLLSTSLHTNLQIYTFFYLCAKACYFIFTIYRFKNAIPTSLIFKLLDLYTRCPLRQIKKLRFVAGTAAF